MSNSESGQTLPWEAAFSSTVERARKAARMSQEEFARRLREYGLSFYAHTVDKIESGAQPIRLNEALVISKVLGVDFPKVTRTVPAELISQAYSKKLAKTLREWDKVVDLLNAAHHDVVKARQDFLSLHSSYIEEMTLADGSQDTELVTYMKAIEEQVLRVKDGLDEIDNELDGALSKPSASASVPGSQTHWRRGRPTST
jgi:transcriptional regulator with XRE-family HTH domain